MMLTETMCSTGRGLLIAAMALALSGCAIFGGKNGPGSGDGENSADTAPVSRKPADDDVKIGQIEYISPDMGFVLIKSSYASRVSSGTELLGRTAEGLETCKLRCTPERKRSFITADIMEGAPEMGHLVYAKGSLVRSDTSGDLGVPGGDGGGGTRPVRPGVRVPVGPDGTTAPDGLPPMPDVPGGNPGPLPDLELD